MKSDWTLLKRIKGGHSYWRHNETQRVAIADGSGTYPENCEPVDNPPLYIDATRPIVIGRGCRIPVVDKTGRTSYSPADGYEALWAAKEYSLVLAAMEMDTQHMIEIEIRHDD